MKTRVRRGRQIPLFGAGVLVRSRKPRAVDVVRHPGDAGRWTIAVKWPGHFAWDYRGNFRTRGEAWKAIGRGDHRRNVMALISAGQLELQVIMLRVAK